MTGIATLGQALGLIENIKDQQSLFDSLSNQLTTGKKTQLFSGLRNDGVTSLRSREAFSYLQNINTGISRSLTRLSITTDAIGDFKGQSDVLRDFLTNISQETVHQKGDIITYDDPLTPEIEDTRLGLSTAEIDSDLTNLKSIANNVYTLLIDSLNIQEGDRYLLSGDQTGTQPVQDLGSLETAVTQLLTDWKNGNISGTELVNNLFSRTADSDTPSAITDNIIGYASELSNAASVFIRTGETSEVEYNAIANDQSFRDALVIAAVLKNDALYPIADAYIEPNLPPNAPDVQGAPGTTLDDQRNNFFDFYNELTGRLTETVNDIDTIVFQIETARVRINDIQQSNADQQNLFLNTISNVEDADINEVAVRLNTLTTQLDASFRVASRLQELSLSNFI